MLNAVGMGYRRLGDHGRATTYLESSLALAHQLGDLRSQALALGNLGVVREDLEQPEAALRYYEDSITLYLSADDPYELARQYTHMGKTLLGLALATAKRRSAFTQSPGPLAARAQRVLKNRRAAEPERTRQTPGRGSV